MRKTIVTCDRCGEDEGTRRALEVHQTKIEIEIEGESPKEFRRDLCGDCIQDLYIHVNEQLPKEV